MNFSSGTSGQPFAALVCCSYRSPGATSQFCTLGDIERRPHGRDPAERDQVVPGVASDAVFGLQGIGEAEGLH